MRRSSLPTLTKTKGASSCPDFDPAKVAGSPFAFLMVAVFAMPSPVRHARRFRCRRSIKNDRSGDQQAEQDRRQHRRHQTTHENRILGYRASDRLLG
jgi:hypothetical protein